MITLHAFLSARLDEDEKLWRLAAEAGLAFTTSVTGVSAVPPSDFSQRMLADVEAKRAIVEAMMLPDDLASDDARRVASISRALVLGHLALPYADHPDYREEWKP